jgi:hypothetical protein
MRGVAHRWKLPRMLIRFRVAWGRAGRAAGAIAFVVVVAPAGATGPVYPGETLTLTLGAPAVVGLETGFVAAGQQADFEDYPLGRARFCCADIASTWMTLPLRRA